MIAFLVKSTTRTVVSRPEPYIQLDPTHQVFQRSQRSRLGLRREAERWLNSRLGSQDASIIDGIPHPQLCVVWPDGRQGDNDLEGRHLPHLGADGAIDTSECMFLQATQVIGNGLDGRLSGLSQKSFGGYELRSVTDMRWTISIVQQT